ncbi:MAG TPA: HAMP domain-containing sensor histidine kinase [Pseudonocardiaceae bacterium]|jgi:two-component system OmpR family sensor kinase
MRALSLRTRLLVELLVLLVVIFALIGVFTELALRGSLIGQLDNRLTSASGRLADPPPRGRQPNGPPPDLDAPGTEVGTLSVLVVNGSIAQARYLGGSPPEPQWVPADDVKVLLSVPLGVPQTVDLGQLGRYRVLAATNPRGDVSIAGLPLAEVESTMLRLGVWLVGVALVGLVLTGAAGALIVRITLRPLHRVADTASRVAELPLDRGEVALSVRVPDPDTDPRTEVGKVGNALNRMLGHVDAALAARQASETRVRQFVADASHELRTPLAAIRGYAELTRRDRGAVPADVAYALQRVESETARMTTLVDDLLLLARLDAVETSGARPLTNGPVDLSRLVVDAASDAHVAGPQHRWQLDLPEESVVVAGDGAQLHHVLGNLLTNARTHTPAGTTVLVRLRAENPHAVLTVTDNGPGIPRDLLPEIFDRFVRGDTSRSRTAGSTGLGLAIVSAVVHAHGGSVAADSEPGRTAFTVHLPLAP